MASSVATPLERQFGRIAGVTEMTSTSYLGTTGIILQFDLNRDIDGAARDVQAAINAARGYLPANLPGNPTYRKVNPADAPIMIISLTSRSLRSGAALRRRFHHHAAEAFSDPRRGPGDRRRKFVAGRARRSQSHAAQRLRPGPRRRSHVLAVQNANRAQGADRRRRYHSGHRRQRSAAQGRLLPAADRGLPQWRGGPALAISPTWTTPSRISAPPA